jgi:prepilin-type processing-associated H-X9-DG protein
MRTVRIVVRIFALVLWAWIGMLFVPLAMMQLIGVPLRDGPAFSDPLVNRIYLVGSVILPVLALFLTLGGDKFVCRSKWLVGVLSVIMFTPLIHLVWVAWEIRNLAGQSLLGMATGMALLELAVIAAIPFLLITGYSMRSSELKRTPAAWQNWLVVVGVVVLVIVLMFLPVVVRPFYHPPPPYACLSNLKRIGLAIAMYSDLYEGRCPVDSTNPTLVGSMQLLSNVFPSATVFYCPHDRRINARAEADFKKLTTDNISYSYVPNLMWQSTPDSALVLDRIYVTSTGSGWPTGGNHKGVGGNILFNDGHVEWNAKLPAALKDKDGKPVVLSP